MDKQTLDDAPLVSTNLPEPSPQTPKTSTDPSPSGLAEPFWTCEARDHPSLSNLPEPPEEPLQSDCCGTGCIPCVFDIYQEDLARWKQLASLSPEERAVVMLQRKCGEKGTLPEIQLNAILKPDEYQTFDVVAIEQVSSDSFVFKFGLPQDAVLGVGIGQHALLRSVLPHPPPPITEFLVRFVYNQAVRKFYLVMVINTKSHNDNP